MLALFVLQSPARQRGPEYRGNRFASGALELALVEDVSLVVKNAVAPWRAD